MLCSVEEFQALWRYAAHIVGWQGARGLERTNKRGTDEWMNVLIWMYLRDQSASTNRIIGLRSIKYES